MKKQNPMAQQWADIVVVKATAGRDDYCANCGWPFDPGDTVYHAPDFAGVVYCTGRCYQRDLERDLERSE